ncbi:DUF4349 domain-containing protein [Eremococcus coleocola]|uniref:DUF4349 domain-containing protein n=1 Tax=Eremococcus coleocola ACS-139-V-Col8 TaxID=908337 RepID=E4KLR7_9LACT|nr:DUF4349 domain-containing protein [Eremococcus coleocola]EFR31925.1 hypothetical protein HMPREF9257_0899 [Eremococcus coleocola ACS-139-V-Col8]
MKRKLILLIPLLLILSACTSTPIDDLINSSTGRNSTQVSTSEYDSAYQDSQSVAYDGSASLESKNFHKDAEDIIKLVTDQDGIIVSQDYSDYHNYNGDYVGNLLTLNAQIPKDKFQDLFNQIKEKYQLANFNLNSQDVSNEMISQEEQLEELNNRLKEVEEDLKDEDITLEQKQALRAEKNSLEDQIKALENQQDSTNESVAYSNLSISLKEVKYYSSEGLPFWLPFVNIFKGFFQYAAIALFTSLMGVIFVIPFLFILSLTYLLIRRSQFIMFRKLENKISPNRDKKNLTKSDKKSFLKPKIEPNKDDQ